MLTDAGPTTGGTGKEYQAGYEFAGEVAAIGDGVDTPAVGERVMGTTPGSFAQYVLADHRHVLPVPDELGYEEACALPTALLTEHGALVVAGFEAGKTVLITGATSSIGLIGVQIARALGAGQLIATTRTADKRDLLNRAGADTIVVTGEQDLTQTVLDATGGEGVDVALDHVGGQTFAACLPATRTDSSVVNIGRLHHRPGRPVPPPPARRRSLLRLHPARRTRRRHRTAGQQLLPALTDARVRPLIDTTLSFDTATKAAERLRSHQAHGKIVLTVPMEPVRDTPDTGNGPAPRNRSQRRFVAEMSSHWIGW